MTTTSIADLITGAADALRGIPDLAIHETLGGPFNVPCAIVELADIESYRETFSRTGNIALPVEVTVLVGSSSTDIAVSRLNEYRDWAGDWSVAAALEADQTLGGVSESVLVDGSQRATRTDLDGAPVFGATFFVTIRAQRERD